jgi:hypothetical protein
MKYVLQITKEDLHQMIKSEVAAEMQALKQQVETAKALPVRLTCVAAAQALGVGKRTFHKNFAHLKRRDATGVYVASEDIFQFKISRK